MINFFGNQEIMSMEFLSFQNKKDPDIVEIFTNIMKKKSTC